MTKTQEQLKKEYHHLIDQIIFMYDGSWGHSERTRNKVFNNIINFVGKKNIDKQKLIKDIKNALAFQTYKKEFDEIAKILKKLRKDHNNENHF